MRLLQFSLRSLLLATVLIALGCAALLNAWPWCATLMLSATLAVLAVAILGSIYRTGRTRAFWLGVAIVGWGYLWLACQPDGAFPDPRPRLQEQGSLVTARLLWHAYMDVLPLVRPRPPAPLGSPPGFPGGVIGAGPALTPVPTYYPPGVTSPPPPALGPTAVTPGTPVWDPSAYGVAVSASTTPVFVGQLMPVGVDYPSLLDFLVIGHSLWALLLGFLGGLLARWFYATRQTRSIP